MPNRRLALILATLAAAAPLARAADPAPTKSILVTITWDGDKATIEHTEPRDMAAPLQRGFPQLWGRFYELVDKPGDEGNVYYAGPLGIPRLLKANPSDATAVQTYNILLPDIPEARHLVVMQRDPKKGSHAVAEKDL